MLLPGWILLFLIWNVFQKIFHCLHDICRFWLQMWQHIFKRIIFVLNFIFGLYFSLVEHRLNCFNGLPLLQRTKYVHLWVCLKVVVIIQSELTEVGQLRLRLPFYFQFTYVCILFYSLSLSPVFSLQFQTFIMHKGSHNTAGLVNSLGGHQVFLV